MRSVRRVCVHWPRFGPLQLNRLRAAHEVLGAAGIDVVALETATTSDTYAWRIEDGATPYERVTIFQGESYDAIAPARMHRAMTEALDCIQPDAVHIHSYSTPDARAALAWCRNNRRVAVCMAESKETDAARVAWKEAVKRVLVSQFDAAQASGSPGARYAAKLGIDPARIFIGYSVVDNAYFREASARVRANPAPARTLPGLGDPTPYFFASGRFMARKDWPTLLRAYGRYRARAGREGVAPWRLVLLGDGTLRPEIEALIQDEQIEAVSLAGWRQIEDLPAYYALASTLVHTATVDQWGLVVNEAMACGLPVLVSTGTGCSEDLVDNGGNGFTFAPGDVATLADRMHHLAHEADLEAMRARSEALIAAWPLERFGTSLLQAVRAGEASADRGLSGPARALITALRVAARSPRSFHAVQD
ncbi:MAG: glycosyltransferase family 4 protein [Bacteroidota bacterium]